MSRPTIRERLQERICPNCGGPVVRRSDRGPPPVFCGAKCKRDHNNRLTVEGRAVIGLLKGWRIDRGSGEIAQRAFQQAVETLDLFNSQDKEKGRPRADYYAATLIASGSRYFDRQRPAKSKPNEESDECNSSEMMEAELPLDSEEAQATA